MGRYLRAAPQPAPQARAHAGRRQRDPRPTGTRLPAPVKGQLGLVDMALVNRIAKELMMSFASLPGFGTGRVAAIHLVYLWRRREDGRILRGEAGFLWAGKVCRNSQD